MGALLCRLPCPPGRVVGWIRVAYKAETTGTSCGGPGEVRVCACPKKQRIQTGLEAACSALIAPFAAPSTSAELLFAFGDLYVRGSDGWDLRALGDPVINLCCQRLEPRSGQSPGRWVSGSTNRPSCDKSIRWLFTSRQVCVLCGSTRRPTGRAVRAPARWTNRSFARSVSVGPPCFHSMLHFRNSRRNAGGTSSSWPLTL